VLNVGGAPIFWWFPTTGTCSGYPLQILCLFLDILDFLDFPHFGLWCCWIGSAHSGLHSHGYPMIAQTRSTELCWSSVVLPYMLTIVSSCSADSGLTEPLAATYAPCLTHAVCSPCIQTPLDLPPVPQFDLLVTGTGEPSSPGSCSSMLTWSLGQIISGSMMPMGCHFHPAYTAA
jgi:hypothetical protein